MKYIGIKQTESSINIFLEYVPGEQANKLGGSCSIELTTCLPACLPDCLLSPPLGGSIASLLYRYGRFNETLMRKFLQQILKGLEYLHAHDIIHRDIKGANVLVDKDGNCKLAGESNLLLRLSIDRLVYACVL